MGATHHSYIHTRPPNSETVAGAVGGDIKRFIPAVALFIGDTVLLSAADSVTKSATAADLAALAGVVVGGDLVGLPDQPVTTAGVVACTATTGYVFVQINGIAYALMGGTVTIGTHLSVIGDSTAGRLIAGTTAGIRVGTPVESGAVGALSRILINQR